MTREESLATAAAWPLLVLTAVLQMYLGLSAVAYLFMGVLKPAFRLGAWTEASMGGLQVITATAAFVLATRRDLRGTTLAVAGSVLLGWLSTLPSAIQQGLFLGDEKVSQIYFAVSALTAVVAAALAWRNVYPTAAALIASTMTIIGIFVVIAFALIIAMYGF